MNSDLMNVIVPIKNDTCSTEELIANIFELHKRWGVRRLLMFGPNKKIRITGFPGVEVFEQIGQRLQQVIQATESSGIQVGWWCTTTFKTGPAPFEKIVGLDGTTSAISSCPLDEDFARALSDRIATVARIARPFLILLEDDFELSNHPGVSLGCFCPLHLQAFSKLAGQDYSRPQLQSLMDESNPQHGELRRQWGQLSRASLTGMAQKIRQAVDQVSPQTRIGLCQPGCADRDGDMTQSVSEALAGQHTRPLIRLCGTAYSSNDSGQMLPGEIFHALYSVQHLPEHHELIHETDTYPHTRYFSSSARVETQLHMTCAYGMTGSLLHCMQYLDDPFEDTGYLDKLASIRPKLDALVRDMATCQPDGCEIVFRPNGSKAWANVLGRYGLPCTTTNGRGKLLSGVTVDQLTDAELESLLSGGLFVDGHAAWLIAKRGYQDCLGVQVERGGKAMFHYERIHPDAGFTGLKGQTIYNMLFAAAGGEKYDYFKLTALPGTRTLSEYMAPDDETPVQPGLTRCTNRLGGRVVVMAGALDQNNSSSIFCYRKKEMIRQLIQWLADGPLPAAIMSAPNVLLACNRHQDNQHIILTVSNLCADTQPQLQVRCEPRWVQGQVSELAASGQWQPLSAIWQDQDCVLPGPFEVMRPRVFKITGHTGQ